MPSAVEISPSTFSTSASSFPGAAASPLMLCDRLITLAQEADRAGFAGTARHLVQLAQSVFDEPRRHCHA